MPDPTRVPTPAAEAPRDAATPAGAADPGAPRAPEPEGSGLSERRASPRRAGSEGDIRSPTLGVRILNLSAAGLAIETDCALRVGGRYRFTLATAGDEARIDGKVLWCRLSGTRRLANGDVHPVYRAGIERLH